MMAGRISFNMVFLCIFVIAERSEAIHGTTERLDCFVASLLAMTVLSQMYSGDDEVDALMPMNGMMNAAEAISHQVTAQQRAARWRGTPHPSRPAGSRDDDQRMKMMRRQDGALRACQMHHVEHASCG